MIKKLIGYGMLAVTAMAAPVAMAQDSENLDVWKRNKGINLSYINSHPRSIRQQGRFLIEHRQHLPLAP